MTRNVMIAALYILAVGLMLYAFKIMDEKSVQPIQHCSIQGFPRGASVVVINNLKNVQGGGCL